MSPRAAAASDTMGYAICPSCHATDQRVTNADVAAGGGWHCARCSQGWDAGRLAAAIAYTDWNAGNTPLLDRSR